MVSLIKTNNQDDFSYYIYDGIRVALVSFRLENKNIVFKYQKLVDTSRDKVIDYLNIFTNFLIRTYRVSSIQIRREDCENILYALNRLMYYDDGLYYVRRVEDIRYMIDNSAFDLEGYIINQGLLTNIDFNLFKVSDKGCGSLATYNLLKMINKEERLEDIISYFSKRSIAFGLLGQDIFTIYGYLKKKAIKANLTLFSKRQCIKDIKKSSQGLILYIHKRGSHYVAYKNLGNNKYKFYNAVYGKINHIMQVEDFFKEYSISPIAMLISIRG